MGDYLTLEGVLNPDTLPDWSKMTDNEILAKVGDLENVSLYKYIFFLEKNEALSGGTLSE